MEEDVDLTVAGRNLKLKVRDGELWAEGHAYTSLWLGVASGREKVRELLERLKWSVVMLSLLTEVLRGEEVYVFQRRGSVLKNLGHLNSLTLLLGDTPVLVIRASAMLGKGFIEYLAATQPVLPIYAIEGLMNMRRSELLGALYLL